MRYTLLHAEHQALGAKFLEFNGWEMPLYYRGILPEHMATRESVTIFDVSHMGRVSITGDGAEALLDFLSANEIKGKKDGSATYTAWCAADGGVVDDLIVFRKTAADFFIVVNAGNREKDLDHLKSHSQNFSVAIQDHYADEGIIAIQGPHAVDVVTKLFPESRAVASMHFIVVTYKQHSVILSATGYTGAGGFELYAPNAILVDLWKALLEAGKDHHIMPAGLGARDTLRLEMGYALYGHEISPTIAPTESVAAWSVKLNKRDFLGQEALKALEKSPKKRSEVAIRLLQPGVIREGLTLFKNGKEIGMTTSGTFSPTLKYSIAIALVTEQVHVGDRLEVSIRNHLFPAEVVSLPFIHH